MRIGIDLGGTKIEGIALDDDGRERARLRVATPAGDYAGDASTPSSRWSRGLEAAPAGAAHRRRHPGRHLARHRPDQERQRDLAERPAARRAIWPRALGRPVRVANDANCFALSEATDGAAAGAAVVFGVILGTGVGGGIVVDGRALGGANAIAGEWGHNPLPWPEDDERPGPACYCGRRGCIETFLCGPGFAARLSRAPAARHALHARRDRRPGAGRRAGGEAALARYERRLARALATVINILDPDVIVLGGGMSNIERLYRTVPRLWGAWVFSDQVATALRRHHHGDSSGVRGAAWLWPGG